MNIEFRCNSKIKASPHLTHKLGPIVSPGKRFWELWRECVCVRGRRGLGAKEKRSEREREMKKATIVISAQRAFHTDCWHIVTGDVANGGGLFLALQK